MRVDAGLLAALASFTLVDAFPQQTAPPNGTSPATTPGITAAPSCAADCVARAPYFAQWSWTTNVITENVTYATVITIINTRFNTTRYVTSTVDLPENYTIPPTNEAGTVVCPVTLYDNTTTLLTYPNVIGDYDSTYSWSGQLFTTDGTGTQSVCKDTGGDIATLRSHPNFNDWWSTYRAEVSDVPVPTTTGDSPYADPRGLNWGCAQETAPFDARAQFLTASFRDERALFDCDKEEWGPIMPQGTAAYLTATSVSYEGGDETSIPTTSDGPKTPATAHKETSVTLGPPEPSATDDGTSSAHTEISTNLEPPTTIPATAHTEKSATLNPPSGPTSTAHTEVGTVLDPPTDTTSTAHTESPVTISVPGGTISIAPTAHTESQVTISVPEGTISAIPTAHTEESTDVEPPWWETSAPGFAHTENPGQPEQPKPTADDTTTATAHTELPTTLVEPGNPPVTAAPPTEVGTVLQPPGTTAQGGGGIGGVIGSLIESYISNGGPQATNVPAEPQQGAGNISPAGTQAPAPPQNIPVGSTTVQVVPTAIPTVIAGTSTNVPAVVVGGTTLTPGQTIVIDNTPISVPTVNSPAPPNEQGQQNNQLQGQPQAPAVIIGGSSTVLLPTYAAAAPSPAPPALTIDGQTIQPTGSAYVISGQTVSPGSPITLGTGPSATVVALTTNAAGSSIVIVGSATIPYTPAAAPAATNAPAAFTIGSQTIQPSGSVYIISGQTLAPGGTLITIGPASARTTLSLTTDAAGNTIAVVNDATQTLAPAAAAGTTASSVTTPGPLVIYGSTILPTDGTAYVYQGQTLTFGGTVTVGAGTSLVLTTNAAGQTVVVQQAGAPTSTAKRTSSSGLGGLINSGLGGSGSARPTQTILSGSGAAVAAATSSGAAVVGRGRVEAGWVGVVLGVLVAAV